MTAPSARFQAAIARATRSSARHSSSARNPPELAEPPPSASSSELSSPPPDEPEASTATTAGSAASPRKVIKKEFSSPLRKAAKKEPSPSLGNLPSLAPVLPPTPRKKPAKKSPGEPEDWERVYDLVKQMRLSTPAPVDTMGCHTSALPSDPPIIQRFQVLISLMLSSQTKDTVTSPTMTKLRDSLPGGLNLQSILAVDPQTLNQLIGQVGFHRRKTEYIKKAAVILKEKFNGDIPDTVEGLCSLPGVGPKMAHLAMGSAWKVTSGIGVDVHVHRIANLWGWVQGKTPEETRAQLEEWLPKEKWREINWLLVGFGQTICLPRGRKCGECKLAEEGLCRAAFKEPGQKRKRVERKKEEESEEEDGVLGASDEEYSPKKVTRKVVVKKEIKMEDGAGVEESPRKRRTRRVVVKTEVKEEEEDDDINGGDIEDAP